MIFILFTAPPSFGLDQASEECLSCHREIIPHQFCPEPGCDHPLGVDYPSLAARNPTLVEPARLNPAVRLVGNAIGCTTCHVPYSRENHESLSNARAAMRDNPVEPDPMLVMPNQGSALCLACHVK